MNINHYPPVSVVGEPEPGQFRIGPHTDFGTVTILDREPVAGGLQVYSDADGWTDAPYDPDALTVNIGDLLEHWSGRRWPSGRHRVLPPRRPGAPDLFRRRPALAGLLLRGQPRRGGHPVRATDRAGVGAGARHVVGVHQGAARRHHGRLSAFALLTSPQNATFRRRVPVQTRALAGNAMWPPCASTWALTMRASS